MPLYEYQCVECGRFEIIHKVSDAPLSACPKCGREVHKLPSAPAIQFKGTGWYITDYARKSSGESASKDGAKDGAKDGTATKDAASSKPADGTPSSTPQATTPKEGPATGSPAKGSLNNNIYSRNGTC